MNDKRINQLQNSRLGFTLVELLIAIGLFTIIVSVAVGGFTNALRTQRQVSSLIATQSNVSLALEQVAREIRTGYLFCHDVNSNSPTRAVPAQDCGCTVSDSLYNPSSASSQSSPSEQPPSGQLSNGDYPLWTCNALDYYTSNGTNVHYSVSGGQLLRSVNGAAAQSITGNNVNVQGVQFLLFGNLEGDNWTPRITIALGVSPSSTDPATMNDVLNLQTTVSARTIDCRIDPLTGNTVC